MVYEQLLGNAFEQIAHTAELFSLNPATDRTYFVKEFSEALIVGYDEITNGLTPAKLEGMAETLTEFRERRNRFLNHLMARFGEQFSEYALLLTNLQGKPVASEHLIEDKTAFLKAFQEISHNRGKAFNYFKSPCESNNISGLKKRVSLLMGYPDLSFNFIPTLTGNSEYKIDFHLNDSFNNTLMSGSLTVEADNPDESILFARKIILRQMGKPEAYAIVASGNSYTLGLNDKDGNLLGSASALFERK